MFSSCACHPRPTSLRGHLLQVAPGGSLSPESGSQCHFICLRQVAHAGVQAGDREPAVAQLVLHTRATGGGGIVDMSACVCELCLNVCVVFHARMHDHECIGSRKKSKAELPGGIQC